MLFTVQEQGRIQVKGLKNGNNMKHQCNLSTCQVGLIQRGILAKAREEESMLGFKTSTALYGWNAGPRNGNKRDSQRVNRKPDSYIPREKLFSL